MAQLDQSNSATGQTLGLTQAWQLRQADRTLLMGVLNITEDSFSDGGLWLEQSAAAEHGRQLAAAGADIIDIGAESTRPGAVRVPEEVEQARVVAAVKDLRGLSAAETGGSSAMTEGGLADGPRPATAPVLSIDTTRQRVAAAALDAGAGIINDVSGGQLDPGLPRLVAERGCLYVVQHWRGWLAGGTAGAADSNTAVYPRGILTDVYEELMRQVDQVLAVGVAAEQIIIDPGLGFSKPGIAYNLPLMAHLDRFRSSGYPVLIGASRKRFVGSLLTTELSSTATAGGAVPGSAADGTQAAGNQRKDLATAVLSAFCALNGAWAVRVHDVQASADALRVAQAWRWAEEAGEQPLSGLPGEWPVASVVPTGQSAVSQPSLRPPAGEGGQA